MVRRLNVLLLLSLPTRMTRRMVWFSCLRRAPLLADDSRLRLVRRSRLLVRPLVTLGAGRARLVETLRGSVVVRVKQK